jgi:hypothetical protein
MLGCSMVRKSPADARTVARSTVGKFGSVDEISPNEGGGRRNLAGKVRKHRYLNKGHSGRVASTH